MSRKRAVKRAVIWAEPALEDVERIVAYLERSSGLAGSRVTSRIATRAGRLDILAERGRVVPELQRLGITRVRELIIRPYRLLYLPDHPQGVLIVAVFDSRRDLEEAIFARYLHVRE